MLKNATVFCLPAGLPCGAEQLEAALASNRFEPCGATQALSLGWVPPRGVEHGALVEQIGQHLLLLIRIEKKTVPGDLVKREVATRCAVLEGETGRKPSKSRIKELKEGVVHELLPQAFPKREDILVWIDRASARLVLNCTSASKSDLIITALGKDLDKFVVAPLNVADSVSGAMSEWLVSGEAPADFSIDQECQLEGGENRPTVTYTRAEVDVEEVRSQIRQGMVPKALALTWAGRISFTLTSALALKKIKFLGVGATGVGADADSFDGTAAIATGETAKAVEALIEAFGGLVAPAADSGAEEGGQASEEAEAIA